MMEAGLLYSAEGRRVSSEILDPQQPALSTEQTSIGI
jgi:hypothetical protein|tara:strand:- start:8847 stop:8957 length:111 start_codon:yes stop_codon:yes gene_type:complete